MSINTRDVNYIVYDPETYQIKHAFKWCGKELLNVLKDQTLKYINVTHPKAKQILNKINEVNKTQYS